MSYDLVILPKNRLADMTTNDGRDSEKFQGYFLMVEGGRIDHALHETTAKKALQDTVAFDNAIKAAIAKAKISDPDLKNTLIVVTADHDHTLVLNGYAKRTGKQPVQSGCTRRGEKLCHWRSRKRSGWCTVFDYRFRQW
jgi:alkaline phosphatase